MAFDDEVGSPVGVIAVVADFHNVPTAVTVV